MKKLIGFLFAAIALILTACIDDGVTTSATDAPTFADDTLRLGRLWAGEKSATAVTTLRNQADRKVVIDRIAVGECQGGVLAINVDGFSGTEFSGVEIRANDSIYILAEATPTGDFSATIEVTVNGTKRLLPVSATTLQPTTLTDFNIESDMTIARGEIVRVFGRLTVARGATLTVMPGAQLFFHDGAALRVDGTVEFSGECGNDIVLGGDRLTDVIAGVPFDVMAGQWEGITFGEQSVGNRLTNTQVRNTCDGVTMLAGSSLSLSNCLISNSQSNLLTLNEAYLYAEGTEFSNAAEAVISLNSSTAEISRSTIVNYYLFALPSEAAITVSDGSALNVAESIVCGDCSPASIDELALCDVVFRTTLFTASGSDDDNFIDCLWSAAPKFLLDLDNYLMDFRLADDSPARNRASSTRIDRYGIAGSSLGAYN